MRCELYGLPGSGKSTLAKRLVAIDNEKFVLVDFDSKLERYFYLLSYIVSHPINFIQWMIFLLNNKKLFTYKAHLLSLSLAKLHKAKNIKNKIALIDEGPLQRVLGITDSALDKKTLSKLLKYLYKLDYIIVLEEGTFHRFLEDSQKHNSPRVKLGKEYLESWIQLSKDNHSVMQEYLLALDGVRVFKYNLIANLDNIDDHFKKITLDLSN